jgi:hypothetical protein
MANEYVIALIGVGGTVIGTIVGARLTYIGERRAKRYQAMRDLAEVRPLLWASSSDLKTLRKILHQVDVSLLEAGAREDLRGALRLMALECWHYDSHYRKLGRNGIQVSLLAAFDSVHRRLLQDLGSGYFQGHFGKRRRQTDALIQRVSTVLDDTIKNDEGAVKLIKLRVGRNLDGVGVDLLWRPSRPSGAGAQQVITDEMAEESEPDDEGS